jgi:hypothetical protein
MNKAQKVFIGLVIACSVGLTYAASVVKDMPDAFDWEDDDE